MDQGEDYQRRLGNRLRSIRGQQGMSLADVEARSNGRWKAVVVGAYERGDRAITMSRLEALAEFYGVPVRVLLADDPGVDEDADRADMPVVIDVTRLPGHDEADADHVLTGVARLVAQIRASRGGRRGDHVTLRGGDLRAVAMASGLTPAQLRTELEAAGVIKSTRP